jgi:Protein of unknown function (DUF3102)
MSLIMKKPKIKAKPLCSRLRGVVRTAADRAVQEGQNPELAKHAAAIRTLGKRVSTDIVEIGRRLTESKKLVVHGNATAADGGWAGWLQTEFQWSEGTALNFMRVYELAEHFKSKNKNFTDLTFADLTIAPSAMYVLARPSTPNEVRDEIMDRAVAGEAITHSTVQEVRANHVAAAVQEAMAPPLAPAADEADTPTPAADEADSTPTVTDEAVSAPPAADEAVSTPPAADEADTITDEADNTAPAADEADTVTDEADNTAPAADEADTVTDEADTIDTVEEALSPAAAAVNPEKENLRRWFNDVVTRASRAMEDGEVANSRPLTPERRQIYQEVVEPTLLPTLRKGGEALIKLADFLDQLFEEASHEDKAPDDAPTSAG